MAKVSVKTVADKLLLKPGKSVRFISAPDNWPVLLGTHAATVLTQRSKQPADVVVLFVINRADLEAKLSLAKVGLAPGGALWVAYRKLTANQKSDIHRDSIAVYARTVGMEPVAMIAIDEAWSCLRCKMIE